jgi:hypothetical protein
LRIAAESYKTHTGSQEAEKEYDQTLEETRENRPRNERLAALYTPRDHKSCLADDVGEPKEGTKHHTPDEMLSSVESRQLTELTCDSLVGEINEPEEETLSSY